MTISAHWQTQIEKWEKSGLTLVIFCQQNNLKYSTFCARLTEYRVIHRALPTQAEVKLIPIEVKHLMVDDYGGYKSLFFSEGEKPACIELACLAHARRKFFDLHQVSQSPLALDAPMSFVVFVGFANTHGGILGDTSKRHSHLQQAIKQGQMPIVRCGGMSVSPPSNCTCTSA